MGTCAAKVSASRPASVMPLMELSISAGIFLFSLAYSSNWPTTARRSASASSGASLKLSSCSATWARKKSPSSTCLICARCLPSIKSLTVPSGSLSICRILATQPTSYKSSAVGSSLAAAFCVTKITWRSSAMAASSALMLLARPTNSGITKCGKTTTSRKGKSASELGNSGVSGMQTFLAIKSAKGLHPHR